MDKCVGYAIWYHYYRSLDNNSLLSVFSSMAYAILLSSLTIYKCIVRLFVCSFNLFNSLSATLICGFEFSKKQKKTSHQFSTGPKAKQPPKRWMCVKVFDSMNEHSTQSISFSTVLFIASLFLSLDFSIRSILNIYSSSAI